MVEIPARASVPGRAHRQWRWAWGGLAFLFAVCLQPVSVVAVTCHAELDRNRVSPGEQITLTVTVEGDFQSAPPVDLPSLAGVKIFGGGTSQNFSFVNGQVHASVSSTFYLQVERESSFTFPALELEIDGKLYRTQPIPVSVVRRGRGDNDRTDASGGSQPAGSGSGPGTTPIPSAPTTKDGSPRGGRSGDEVFITMSTDRDHAYVGQQIVLTFRFHRRVQLWKNPQYTAPRAEGFWREDLPPERSYLQDIAGFRYHVTEIRYALFPTRPGQLFIEPAEVNIPVDVFDRFFSFRRRRTRSPERLRTDHLALSVSPLPTPRPDRFSGIVASQLTLTTTVDRDTVPRGEPVGLRVELTADGFLKGVTDLPLSAPAGVQMHDAVEDVSLDKSGERLLSRYSVEKVLIPTEAGSVVLDPVVISYFNPAASRYETVRREGASLFVFPSDLPVAGDGPARILRGEIERLGQDLAFIHTAAGRLQTRLRPLVSTPLWWVTVAFPLLILAGWRWWLTRLELERRDPLGRRRRRALVLARATLLQASRQGDHSQALAAIAGAILGYVADRSGGSASALAVRDVRAYASAVGCETEGECLAGILDRCDAVRFGDSAGERVDENGGTADLPPALARESEKLLTALDRTGDRQLPTGLAVRLLLLGLMSMPSLVSPLGAQETVAPQATRGPDPVRLLAEGNRAYTGGDIDTALTRYQSAIAAGVNDAVLHYNLGNAQAREGHLGRAILWYLRAQRLAPRDPDIRANLAWVRSHTRDRELSPGRLPPVIAHLVGTVRALSLDEWSRVLVLVVWLVCVLVAWAWYRGTVSDNLRRLLLAGGGLLCCLVLVVGWLWYEQEVHEQAVVVIPEAEVRSGPATSFPVVFRVHDGLTLTLRGEREDWVRIGLGGEWVGWVPAAAVARVRVSITESTGPATGSPFETGST